MLHLYVNSELDREDYDQIYKFMTEEEGIEEIFGNKLNRFFSASFVCLIVLNDRPIGFLNVLSEHTNNLLFLDSGIIKKYRGKGYGTEAKKIFLERYSGPEYILSEIKKTNIAANRSSSHIGTLIHQNANINYYLLNKNPEEFYASDAYTEFLEHIDDNHSKKRVR